MTKVVLWDFDGTLGRRPWSATMIAVLDRAEPGHAVTAEALTAHLHTGFPWHDWETPHPELSTPDAWWERLEPVLASAYAGVGYDEARSRLLARLAHEAYVDPAGYQLYPDARPALQQVASAGWQNVILSNHSPELPAIVEALGLGDLVSLVVTSAATGYEKPHPRAFGAALAAAGHPDEAWMVGDNPIADGWGAEQAGLRTVLIRRREGPGSCGVADCQAAARAILGPPKG